MTLRHFLSRTRSLPAVAVRAAMIDALAARLPARLQGRRSYDAFYGAVLLRLVKAGPPVQPILEAAPNGWAADADVRVSPADDTYRRLAASVIARAFRDVTAPVCAPSDRESARDFLSGSPLLFHWCSVATLDPRRVIACATALRERRTSTMTPHESTPGQSFR